MNGASISPSPRLKEFSEEHRSYRASVRMVWGMWNAFSGRGVVVALLNSRHLWSPAHQTYTPIKERGGVHEALSSPESLYEVSD